MAIEIEKKYRLDEEKYASVVEALEEFSAEYAGEDFEENTIYSNRRMAREKCVLRIRKIADRTILTFKKRIENQLNAKRQIEHETEVSDSEALKNIVENLNMRPVIIYEKRRKKWKFRNTEVVLDELPFGLFMEIEGKFMDIAQAEMLLGAEDFTIEPKTYVQLTKKKGQRNGQIIEARFPENLENLQANKLISF